MSSLDSPIVDALTGLASPDIQQQTARLTQDIFAQVFRNALNPTAEQLGQALRELETRCLQWAEQANSNEAQQARMALLIQGLDQWGLAYTQAFELNAIPALSALIASLRSRMTPQSDALFQQAFEQIEAAESNAIDFKVLTRRSIHLALWHAMGACETQDEAQGIVQSLGNLLLALMQHMPTLGWRLVADALAHMQIALINNQCTDIGKDGSQVLFESLRQALPQNQYQAIMLQSGQVVIAWQQAQRNQSNSIQ